MYIKHKCSETVKYTRTRWYTGCFRKKSNPQPKTFWNIFTSVKSFCVKFCEFVGNSYPHLSINFCRFILIFHQMALFFSTTTHRFCPLKFWIGLFTQKMIMQIFGNDVFFVIECLSNCKQSITVWFFLLLTFYWHCFKAGRTYQWENCFTTTNGTWRRFVSKDLVHPDKGWKLSTIKKVCSRVNHIGSAILRKSGSRTAATALSLCE